MSEIYARTRAVLENSIFLVVQSDGLQTTFTTGASNHTVCFSGGLCGSHPYGTASSDKQFRRPVCLVDDPRATSLTAATICILARYFLPSVYLLLPCLPLCHYFRACPVFLALCICLLLRPDFYPVSVPISVHFSHFCLRSCALVPVHLPALNLS